MTCREDAAWRRLTRQEPWQSIQGLRLLFLITPHSYMQGYLGDSLRGQT